MNLSPQDLALAYLKQFRTGADEDFWAFDAVVDSCVTIEEGIPVTIALVNAAEEGLELSYVAAGPVEDMLKLHGEEALKQLKSVAEHNGQMRRALEGVWLDSSYPVYEGWLETAKELGLSVQVPRDKKKAKSKKRKTTKSRRR